MAGGKQFVHCREVVLLSECPLSEVLLYIPGVHKGQMPCTTNTSIFNKMILLQYIDKEGHQVTL